jgi:hypothetical protein
MPIPVPTHNHLIVLKYNVNSQFQTHKNINNRLFNLSLCLANCPTQTEKLIKKIQIPKVKMIQVINFQFQNFFKLKQKVMLMIQRQESKIKHKKLFLNKYKI